MKYLKFLDDERIAGPRRFCVTLRFYGQGSVCNILSLYVLKETWSNSFRSWQFLYYTLFDIGRDLDRSLSIVLLFRILKFSVQKVLTTFHQLANISALVISVRGPRRCLFIYGNSISSLLLLSMMPDITRLELFHRWFIVVIIKIRARSDVSALGTMPMFTWHWQNVAMTANVSEFMDVYFAAINNSMVWKFRRVMGGVPIICRFQKVLYSVWFLVPMYVTLYQVLTKQHLRVRVKRSVERTNYELV